MMENRYDKYKDSGIAWIGEIPEHWKITKIQYLAQLKSGYSLTTEEITDNGLYPVYGGNGIRGYYDKYFLEGDYVLIGRQGALCGNINYSTNKSWATEHAVVCYPKIKYVTRWFGELLRVMNLNQYSLAAAQPGLAVERIKLLPIPIIPLPEQQSIAAYLDQKCGEIDELITLQEEMITKLQSYKQSVITEAVTKGLDKNVPLKDSGIEWIGEIPEHWEVRRMKSIYNFGKGLSITKADLVDKGIPVISYGQIHSKLNIGTCIKDSLIRYVPKVFLENNNTSLVKKGDVIFADTSEDLEGCGNCIYIDMDMLLYAGYHTIIAKNISTSYNRYFSYLFQTDCWRFQIRRMVNGVKLFSIPQKLLASADLIVPSTQEQQSIADYLDQRCSEIDELISIKQQKIEKLKEYKKSLIFECVTGKRKVS